MSRRKSFYLGKVLGGEGRSPFPVLARLNDSNLYILFPRLFLNDQIYVFVQSLIKNALQTRRITNGQ